MNEATKKKDAPTNTTPLLLTIMPGFLASFPARRLIQLARRKAHQNLFFSPTSICLGTGLFFIPKTEDKK